MKRLVVLTALVAVGSFSIGAAAFQQAKPLPGVRAIQKLKDNLYYISGGDTTDRSTWTGGNTAVLVTEKGVVLVDTMLAQAGRGILEQVRLVTDKPVTTIINTHTHYDHTGSNTEFPDTVEFVAHENTRANMAMATCPPVTNCDAFKGANAKYLPKRTYRDTLSLFSGKDRIDLHHFGRGHTNGDTFVVFPAVGAMHAGDMFPRSQMPLVDVSNGGSAVDFSSSLDKAVSSIKNVDTVIGGHTPSPVSWTDFTTYAEFYREFVASARASMKNGIGAEAFAKSYRPADKFKAFLLDPQRVLGNAQAVYKESGR
jgi:glyoxylase-like metal-dependent hydrolase (beta-lactamase superfamily II)